MIPLVSILIPTYNRAHLLPETLDSIVAQTYTNWECIVVDDGSDDDTETLVHEYAQKDARFTFVHRPDDKPRGGNAARNYGLTLAKGDFIQWFDSDDLMAPTKIEAKVEQLKNPAIDFVISKTKYFNKDIEPYHYNYPDDAMNFDNYAMGEVTWFTPDLMIKKEALGTIRYNETLKAGQEYNFTCKLLTKPLQGARIDAFLSLRRWHEASIGNRRKRDIAHYWETKFYSHWRTYLDIKAIAPKPEFERYSLLKCVLAYCNPKASFRMPPHFLSALKEVFGNSAYYVYLAKASGKLFNRPYYFYNKLK